MRIFTTPIPVVSWVNISREIKISLICEESQLRINKSVIHMVDKLLPPSRYTAEGPFLLTVRNWKTHLFTLTLLTWSPQLELSRLSLRLAWPGSSASSGFTTSSSLGWPGRDDGFPWLGWVPANAGCSRNLVRNCGRGNSEEGSGSTRSEAWDPLRSFYGPSFDEEIEATNQQSYSDTWHFISQLNTHTHWHDTY
jgi:hypothetical protein